MNRNMFQKISRVFLHVAISMAASLVTLQSAQATSYYNHYHHNNCGNNGADPACGQTAEKSFYDFADRKGNRNDSWVYLEKGDTQKITINYEVDDGWSVDSAWLRIYAKDETLSSLDSGWFSDGSEKAKYVSIEGHPIAMTATEIDGLGWYLDYDVTSLLQGSLFEAVLKADKGDFKYLNAELKLSLSTEDCPPVNTVPLPAAMPLMLTGLGFLGFAKRRRNNAA